MNEQRERPDELSDEELTLLALSLDRVEPPAPVRESILFAVRREAEASTLFVPAAAPAWRPHVVAGVECKELSIDRKLDRATFLMRLPAGTLLPVHEHVVTEECFVVSGSFAIGGSRYAAGDFIRAAGGTAHGPILSDEGCVVLLSTSTAEYYAGLAS